MEGRGNDRTGRPSNSGPSNCPSYEFRYSTGERPSFPYPRSTSTPSVGFQPRSSMKLSLGCIFINPVNHHSRSGSRDRRPPSLLSGSSRLSTQCPTRGDDSECAHHRVEFCLLHRRALREGVRWYSFSATLDTLLVFLYAIVHVQETEDRDQRQSSPSWILRYE